MKWIRVNARLIDLTPRALNEHRSEPLNLEPFELKCPRLLLSVTTLKSLPALQFC